MNLALTLERSPLSLKLQHQPHSSGGQTQAFPGWLVHHPQLRDWDGMATRVVRNKRSPTPVQTSSTTDWNEECFPSFSETVVAEHQI